MNKSILKEMINELGKENGTEQFLIQFTNILVNHLGGWLNKCKYKSIGNVIHWVYVYSSMLSIAEVVTVGTNEVRYRGEILATYTFDDNLKMPIFDFTKNSKFNIMADKQRIYIEGLHKPALTIDIIEKYSEKYSILK